MANNIFKGLLDKSSSPGTSWGELAGMYFSKGSKKDVRARNILLGTLFFNAKEASMQSKVLKNLEEANRNKLFDEAEVTAKWNAYNTLMDDDAAYKSDPNYFKYKAEEKFTKVNPNFPTGQNLLQSQIDFRRKEIEDYATALENNHLEKIKTGNITQRLRKEEFFKPFEDFYVSENERIAAAKNVSLVHKGWDFLTGGKKKDLTEAQIKDARNAAAKNNLGYLLNPDSFTAQENIELYRDPSVSTFTADEVKRNIISTVDDASLAKSIINNMDPKQATYTRAQLDSLVIGATVDFDELTFKFEQAGKVFDKNYKTETGKDAPQKGQKDYLDYKLRRTNFAEERAGIGDRDTIELRKKIYLRQDLISQGTNENDAIIKSLDAFIKNAGIDKFKLTMMNTALASAADPETKAILDKQGISITDYVKDYMSNLESFYKIFDES